MQHQSTESSPGQELLQAVARLESELPGWWWRVGHCHVSSDASIGPDYNDPAHGARLHDEWPDELFDQGLHIDLPQPSTLAAALHFVIDEALARRNPR